MNLLTSLAFFFIFFLKLFYLSIVDLQCCINFCSTAMIQLYIYAHSFSCKLNNQGDNLKKWCWKYFFVELFRWLGITYTKNAAVPGTFSWCDSSNNYIRDYRRLIQCSKMEVLRVSLLSTLFGIIKRRRIMQNW